MERVGISESLWAFGILVVCARLWVLILNVAEYILCESLECPMSTWTFNIRLYTSS